MKSLEEWLEAWVRTTPNWEQFAPKGKGITEKLVAANVLFKRLKSRREDLKQTDRLTEQQAQPWLDHLEQYEEELQTLLSLARVGIDETMALAEPDRLNMYYRKAAEGIIGPLGTAWSSGHLMSDEEVGRLRDNLISRCVPASRVLTREDLLVSGAHFLTRWQQDGQGNLEREPYSAYGLGDDIRPFLIPLLAENIFDGLNRSIYTRASKAAADPQVVGDEPQIVLREIDRACDQLGLLEESSRVLLRSIHAGFEWGPKDEQWQAPTKTNPQRNWKTMTGELRPEAEPATLPGVPQGPHIHEALAARTQALVASFAKSEPTGRLLLAQVRMAEACQDGMRRAWDEAFIIERRGGKVTGVQAARISHLATNKAILSGQANRIRRLQRVKRLRLETLTSHRIYRRVTEWIREDSQRLAGLLRNDPGVVEDYDYKVSQGYFPPREDFLILFQELQ